MADADLVDAVLRIRSTAPTATAAEVHAALKSIGRELSLSEVKRACSKATKQAAARGDTASSQTAAEDIKMDASTAAKLESMGISDVAAARQAREAAHAEEVKRHNKQVKEIQREYKDCPERVVHVSGTAFGLVAPGLPLPDGVPVNFALKQKAAAALDEGVKPGGVGNMRSESVYREYYDDLVADRATWLRFFEYKDNFQHAENTCGILGTLATIYRQRGWLEDCERVLDMESEVLVRYEQVSVGAEAAQVSCCQKLAYLYHIIRYNLCLQLERYSENIELYRKLALYEAERDYSFEESNFLFMIPGVLKKKATAKVLRRLTDEEVMRIIMAPMKREGFSFQTDRVQLRVCAVCHAQEPSLGTFPSCACKVVYYCGKDCQKKDWAGHKGQCAARKSKG